MDAALDLQEIRTSVDSYLAAEGSNIRDRVQRCVSAVLDRKAGRIPYDDSLIERCGADSLDFVDLVFRLEDEFGVELAVDFIQESVRRGIEADYDANRCLSQAALSRLRTLMPEADPERLTPSLMPGDIPALFTTETFVRMVAWRLAHRAATATRG
jgi:acyl carrier protein